MALLLARPVRQLYDNADFHAQGTSASFSFSVCEIEWLGELYDNGFLAFA
jgi:hypothetical protein